MSRGLAYRSLPVVDSVHPIKPAVKVGWTRMSLHH